MALPKNSGQNCRVKYVKNDIFVAPKIYDIFGEKANKRNDSRMAVRPSGSEEQK